MASHDSTKTLLSHIVNKTIEHVNIIYIQAQR